MKESVIIQTIHITRKGELQHFQIALPTDTAEIIGIETAMSEMMPLGNPLDPTGQFSLQLSKNVLIGELKLQSCDKANWFYAEDVVEQDLNLNYGDYTCNAFWHTNQWTHGNNRFECEVSVGGESSVLLGWYRDEINEQYNQQLSYKVNIYVWYRIKQQS